MRVPLEGLVRVGDKHKRKPRPPLAHGLLYPETGLAFLLEATNLELTLELLGLRKRRHRVLEPRISGPAVIVATKHQHTTGGRRSGEVD